MKPKSERGAVTKIANTPKIFIYRKEDGVYVGSGVVSLMSNLNITEQGAVQLMISKMKEKLKEIEDIRTMLLRRIKEYKGKIRPKICPNCGKEMGTYKRGRKFCSPECQLTYRRKKYIAREG